MIQPELDDSHTMFRCDLFPRRYFVKVAEIIAPVGMAGCLPAHSILTCLQSGHIQPTGTNFPLSRLYIRCILKDRSLCLQSLCAMSMKDVYNFDIRKNNRTILKASNQEKEFKDLNVLIQAYGEILQLCSYPYRYYYGS